MGTKDLRKLVQEQIKVQEIDDLLRRKNKALRDGDFELYTELWTKILVLRKAKESK